MPESVICHTTNCGAPATVRCDVCQRPCCANHLQRLALERRQEVAETLGRRDMLARVPSQITIYLLCPRCGKRPFDGVARRSTATAS